MRWLQQHEEIFPRSAWDSMYLMNPRWLGHRYELPTSVPSRALVRLCKGGAKPCTPLARFMVGQLEPLVCKQHPIRVRSVPVPTCRPLRKRPWNRTEICFLYVLVMDFSLGIIFNPCLQTRSRHAGGAASIPSRPFALQLKT